MGYLQPTDYESFGLASDTTDDWITVASALIDSHCRRLSLNPTQYVERLRLTAGSQTVRLSYLPLTPIAPATSPFVNIQARYARPRRGQMIYPLQEEVAVQQQVGALQLTSADALLDTAAGVEISGSQFLIESHSVSQSLGQVYLYRLLLREAHAHLQPAP